MARTSLSTVFAGSGGADAMTAGAVLLRGAARPTAMLSTIEHQFAVGD